VNADAERALAFEVGGVAFALPLADVREVAEIGELHAVPTLPREIVSVANHRGDALPVVSAPALLEVGDAGAAREVLVIGGRGDEPGRMGLPVDRVLGLARAPRSRRDPSGVAEERATLDGRELLVLDAARLIERAEKAIVRSRRRP